MIELDKALSGQKIDEWIRFFNVKTQEELDMLRMQTKNVEILEVINEVEHMSLTGWMMARYDEHMRRGMDRKAEDAYVFDQGRQMEKENMLKLITSMNAGGDADKITQLNDPKVLEAMQKKYGME